MYFSIKQAIKKESASKSYKPLFCGIPWCHQY